MVTAAVRVTTGAVVEGATVRASTELDIGPEELTFDGHYPDLPIFPGVALIECARMSCVAVPPPGAGQLHLAAVDSTRFHNVVRPNDRLSLDLSWKRLGADWRASVRIRSWRGDVASVRLLFRTGETS
jgi:3-hydroxyacyl-[acyl-carrier-protein] dehydratase